MKIYAILGVMLILLLASCSDQGPSTVTIQPFIGGSDGVSIGFDNLKKQVADSGQEPFDVVVKLQNIGEVEIPKDKVVVKLSGIRPEEFSQTDVDLKRRPDDSLSSRKKDSTGKVIDGVPVWITFTNLNHAGIISGATLQFPLQADVCHWYQTKSVSKLCVRKDLVSSSEGLCKIEENKPIFNSGAPVQIDGVRELVSGKDKLRFTFDIKHVGKGTVYEKDSGGCELDRQKNKVFVKVETAMDGLSCTGFTGKDGKAVTGTVSLLDGPRTISCSQEIASKGDYETPIKIEVTYDYDSKITDQLTVKHVGE